MGYNGTKLVYSNGKPQWLMPDGSFIPTRSGRKDVFFTPGSLYLKDRTMNAPRLIQD